MAEQQYSSIGNGPVFPGYICRFCSTRDQSKNMVSREAGNVWSPTICEDCIDACSEALKGLRRSRSGRG